MTAETDKLYASLPRYLQEDIDRRALLVREHVRSVSSVAQMSRGMAREVVIKTLEFVAKKEVVR